MTLLQEAYDRIDNLSENKIKQVIIFMDLIENNANAEYYYSVMDQGRSEDEITREERMNKFFSTVGNIQIDARSIQDLRERSMI